MDIICSNNLWIYLTAAGGLLLLFCLAFFAMAVYAVFQLMKPIKRDDDFLIDYETKEKEFDSKWLDIPYTQKHLQSDFGYKLHGRLYLNNKETNKFMLLLHGHNNSSIGQLKYLGLFLDLGFNVFIPDHRFSGKSGGKSITFGQYEKFDTIRWIDLLQSQFKSAQFYLFGESMGAATAIMVASMDKRIRLLIEYCGFSDFEELSLCKLKKRWLYKLFSPFFYIAAKLFFNVSIGKLKTYKAMQSVEIPTLILHSKADELVPFANAIKLQGANPKANAVFFEKAGHARSLMTHRDVFTNAIVDFVKKNDA